MKNILVILIFAIAVPLIGAGGFVGFDILQDRQQIAITKESVPAYSDWEPYPSIGMKHLFVLQANTKEKVNRIRYGKQYMAVRVENTRGEIGWIFYRHLFSLENAT
jgi:hypothetical protein